jgi:transcriptional regulator with GAF, ATPase, and Fis domain
LTESLEQQTATAEVLRIISSSPGELEPAFTSLLENATRVCHANFGNLVLCEDDGFRNVAIHNAVPVVDEFFPDQLLFPHPESPLALAARQKRPTHIVDLRATEPYRAGNKAIVMLADVGGARTFLCVPMLKETKLAGVIILYRNEVRPFTDEQIELVKNFGAQAVIAIENTRLLNELRQRTAELTESLEQQTATADVLRVIASSPTDIQPVLEAIVRTAGELCSSEYAILFKLQDGKYQVACANNAEAEWVEYFSEHPINVDRGSLVGRTALERRSVHILDCTADPEYKLHEAARLGRHRSMLGVRCCATGFQLASLACCAPP